ncbi:MAG: putative manganese transporter [Bacteroidota bacterium]
MIVEVLKHSIMITVFVIVMMIVIEFINVQSKGNWNAYLKKSGWLQIFIAGILGIFPGCLGSFAAVSLYVHNSINFAALVTVMIATSGDEIFVMFAMMPNTSLKLIVIIFLIAIISGFIIYFFTKKNYMSAHHKKHDLLKNDEAVCSCFESSLIMTQIKNITFHRSLLLIGVSLFIIFLISGDIGPENWGWEKITFLIITSIGGFVVLTTTDHFLLEHIWKHVIKKHMLKIFLWTFGAFLIIHLLEDYIDVNQWIQNHVLVVLLIAVLIGIIPESGPHIVFISLFISGAIPFSILLANSIVQDGHGAIPLLAESRKSFFMMKVVNVLVGLIVGGTLYFFGI